MLMKYSTGMVVLGLLCSMTFSNFVIGADSSKKDLTGIWILNEEETNKVTPKTSTISRKKGLRNTGVTGVLVPNQRSRITPSKTINPPLILDCMRAELEHLGQQVQLTCNEIDTRIFLLGKEHGRVAKWKGKTLTERYSSTSRSVQHAFKLVKEDRMEVTVQVKPRGAKKLRYILVYDRSSQSVHVQ